MSKPSTDRRNFLKAGALAATPVAALAPAAALAADDTRERLARLEDEQAIRQAARRFMRSLGVREARRLDLGEDIARLSEDSASDPLVDLPEARGHATYRAQVKVHRLARHDGETTIEKMVRFQGQPSSAHVDISRLELALDQQGGEWNVTTARFLKT